MSPSPERRWLSAGLTAVVLAVALTIGISLRGSPVLVQDSVARPQRSWPLFGGSPQRHLVNTADRNLSIDWDVQSGKHIKWKALLGSRAYGGPTVAGGRIFVGTNNEVPRNRKIKGDRGVLMCFNEADGQFLWQAVHEKLPSGQVNDWPREGIASAPAIDGDRLYYVSNRCELVCADVAGTPETGEARIVWRLDMMKELGVFPHNLAVSAPLVAGELVFTGTSNGVDEEHVVVPAPQAPSFVAVNKRTGKLVWKSNLPSSQAVGIKDTRRMTELANRGRTIMHGQWAHPSLATVKGKQQLLFPGGDGWLYSFEPESGDVIWKFDANPKNAKYGLGGKGTRSDFICAPAIVGNRCYIGTGQDPEHYEGVAHLWCIDITRTGDISPELVTDATVDPPRTKPNPNSGAVWCYGGPVKKEDQDRINRDYYFGRTISTMCVHEDLVYASEIAGYLHCVDAKTGKPYWTYDLKAAVWGSPLWVDNKVYVPTEDGDVWVFAHGRDKVKLAQLEMGQPVRSTLVAANGVLFVMTESTLFAIAR